MLPTDAWTAFACFCHHCCCLFLVGSKVLSSLYHRNIVGLRRRRRQHQRPEEKKSATLTVLIQSCQKNVRLSSLKTAAHFSPPPPPPQRPNFGNQIRVMKKERKGRREKGEQSFPRSQNKKAASPNMGKPNWKSLLSQTCHDGIFSLCSQS